MSCFRRAVAVVLVAMLVAACAGSEDGISGPADHHFTIPAGAGEALEAGEPLDVLPAELQVEVGEVIEIANQDERGHRVGPFFIDAGATLRRRFASPGAIVGTCTLSPSGEIEIVVTEP